MDGDENCHVQDSSDSCDVLCSDDLFSSGSDLFGEEEDEEDEENSSPPLPDMSALLQELPFKKGLSKHYNGKSQSFSSLSNVRSLEDLAKPENPLNKKLKSCRSYGGLFLEASKKSHGSSSSSSKLGIMKKSSSASRNGGFCSSLGSRKNGSFFIGNKPSHPPPPPHRSASSTNFANQTPLLA
ncbi:hypothetical protein DM860_016239 [Cuscuta australis]|uniref:Oxidative stress 3 n=1 Tax=Cuscuta australis TaxID=267555 RepID=A0A328E4U2_9ASTE|nr:hypothetical protein DM860_016239 [Cuscuta australis]